MLRLQSLEVINHLIEERESLFQILPRGSDVNVMEAIVINPQDVHEFKSEIGLCFVCFQRIGFLKAFIRGRIPEHVRPFRAKRVPITHGEFQMVFHLLSENHFFRIVVFETELLLVFAAPVLNFSDFPQVINLHTILSVLLSCSCTDGDMKLSQARMMPRKLIVLVHTIIISLGIFLVNRKVKRFRNFRKFFL